MEGYEKFQSEYQTYLYDEKMTGRKLVTKYFKTIGMLPGENELEDLLSYIRQEKEFPELRRFDIRDQIEPYAVSEQIKAGKVLFGESMDLISTIFEQNKQFILSLYGSFDYYKKRIVDCLMFPKGFVPIGTQIEEIDKSVYELRMEPIDEQLEDLLTEVMIEQKENLPENFKRPEIHWTDRPQASYFGIYYHDYNLIYINSLLNSVSVPIEVIKFVIYHECLHQEYKGHPKEFREKERKYPEFQKQEHFLDYTLRDFDLKNAM